jgi:cullin 3
VESDKERKETEKKNDDSRGFAIEAAVVRIMKSRKELPHAQLLQQTIEVLTSQFKPDVNMIKKRIESLIEREYLERMDEAPVPSYRYLA